MVSRLFGSGDPFSVLQREVNRVFDEVFRTAPARVGLGGFAPDLDVHETGRGLELTAELPGMAEGDIDLRLEGDLLTLSGEKQDTREKAEGGRHMSERSFGRFQRSFRLPFAPDAGQVQARFDKGVLHVTLPRPAQSQGGGRIPIQAGQAASLAGSPHAASGGSATGAAPEHKSDQADHTAHRQAKDNNGRRSPLPQGPAGGRKRLPTQIKRHLPGAVVAVLRLGRTSGADHPVQPLPGLQLVIRLAAGGDVWEIQPVLSCARLIQNHAQGKDVRGRRTRPFRCHKPLRAHETALSKQCHQADVGQPAMPVDEDQVRRFDIAVDELVFMQVLKPFRDIRANRQTALRLELLGTPHLQTQRVRLVSIRMNVSARLQIVGQLHHIIIKALRITTPHLEDRHQAGMTTRDGFVSLDRLKLALKRVRVIVVLPPDHLHRTQGSGHRPRHPHLSIGAPANETQGLMIADFWSLTRC